MSKPAHLSATRATAPAVSSLAVPRRSGIALALLAAFGTHVPALAAPVVTVNNIVPNLKTNTVLTPGAANTTDITTTTIKAGVGLNTFSTFEVGAGNTVNLHVPTTANMLLNVVYDSPILVNGIVNGYKDGVLGGKIAFADPHGMVVGASGVLNVGSLSVLTPRADFLAGMIDTIGAVDVVQLDVLLAGGAPVSADGLITIAGRINALDNISLRGAVVNVNGVLNAGADVAHLAAFTSTVNTTGMPQAAGVVAHDGIIEIVAAGAATVSGTLEVTHTTDVAASSVGVTGTSVAFNAGGSVTTHGANVAANGEAITVANSASIDAGTGNVTLAAKSEDLRAGMGDRAATATLAVDGTLKAANIALTADASAQSDDTSSISNAIIKDASTAAGLFGFKWAETLVNATANVTIGEHAVVTATDALTISASAKQANKLNVALGDSLNPSINSIAAHATVKGGATTLVKSGATLSSGGQMVVQATNDAALDLKASVLSYSTDVGVTFAYGESKLATAAAIEHGATLAAGGLDVISHSGSSYSVQASSSPADTGKAGIAAAVSSMQEASSATLGANITTSGAVRVQADTVVAKNFTKGSTETGSGLAGKFINPAIMTGLNGKYDLLSTGSSLLVNLLGGAMDKANAAAGGDADTSTTFKVGAALALVDDAFGASAAIAPLATIKATGDVVVLGHVEDHIVHNIAQSSVNSATSPGAGTSTNPAAQFSGSAGVALAFIDHDASATIGHDASVDALHIAVDSAVIEPLDLTWAPWANLSAVSTYLSAKLGVPETILTSYANASGESTEGTLAGAFSWFQATNTSRAWVGQHATLVAHAADDANYTTTLATVQAGGTAATLALPAAITVRATNEIETVTVAGNISATIFSGSGGGTGGIAVGGAFNGTTYENTTTAGIDDYASVKTTGTAPGGLLVTAASTDKAFVIAPSSGKGASIGVNGTAAYATVDNNTSAAISNRAQVATTDTDVTANEALSVFSLAGSLASTSGTSVGVGVAYNDLLATTSALVDDVTALHLATDGISATAPGSVVPGLTTGTLHVGAASEGVVYALSVAGANASTPTPEEKEKTAADAKTKQAKIEAEKATLAQKSAGAQAKSTLLGLLSPIRIGQALSSGEPDPAPAPEASFAVAGSSSINVSKMQTLATIDNATVKAATLVLDALNNTDLIAASGSAARVAAGAASVATSAAVAGALAISLETNTTRALATGSSFTGLSSASIAALSSGQHIAVGLGVASNSQSEGDSASAVGSASAVVTSNVTDGGATGNNFTYTASGDLKVLAYDRTDIGAGGVAAAMGGNTAVGVALTYADIGNTVQAHLDGATVLGAGDVTVAAFQPARIMLAALEGAKTDGTLAAGASIGVAIIHDTTSAAVDGVGSDVHAATMTVVATDDANKEGKQVLLDGALADGRLAQHSDQALFDFNKGVLPGQDAPTGTAIINAAGAFQSSDAAIGAALAYSSIDNTTSAVLTGGATANQVNVRAADWSAITSIAAGVASGKGDATGVGSATISLTTSKTTATLGAAGLATTITAPVSVSAETGATIWSGAGSLAKSDGNSLGAAIAYNDDRSATTAAVNHATLDAGNGAVTVAATQDSALHTLALAVAYSGEQNALGGSYAQNHVGNTTSATWLDSDLNKNASASGTRLAITADDSASIEALAGGLALSSKGAAAGAAVTVNQIDSTTTASLLGGANAAARAAQAQSVLVTASTDADITSIAIGAGLANGEVGLGGSSAANISDTTTTATIDQGANVVASHNVGVIATGENTVSTFAGAAGIGLKGVGLGVATTVNLLTDKTSALVGGNDGSGPATRVTSLGGDLNDQLTVNTGLLDGTISLVDSLTSAATINAATLTETKRKVTGLAVNATSLSSLASMALSAGVGRTGGASGIFATSLIGGSATAQIAGAQINQGRSLVAGSGVDVEASTHGASATLAGSVAGSGSAALGIAVDTELWSGQTTARVVDSTISAGGKLAIDAQQSVSLGALGAGVAVGGEGGGAGTGLIAHLAGATTAQLVGGSASAASVAVKANSLETVNMIGGAIGAGGSVGLGGVYAVIDTQQSTLASIGDSAHGTTVAATAGDVTVDAATAVNTHLIAAAVGASTAVGAGLTVGLVLDENTTAARVVNVGSLNATGALSVTAAEVDQGMQAIGAAGVGVTGAGIGAAVAVTDSRAQVAAQIAGSTTNTRAVTVRATNDQQINSTALSLGAGLYAGVGGAVSIVQLGSGDSGAGTGVLGNDGALGNVNTLLTRDNTGTTTGLSAAELQALRGSGIAPASELQVGARNSASATVESSRVTTTSDAMISAMNTTGIVNTAGGAAVGAGAVGGSAAVSAMYNATVAGVDATSSVTTGGALYVSAGSSNGNASDAITERAYGGAAGIVGLGASVGLAHVDNQVAATVGGSLAATQSVVVSALDTTSVDVQAATAAFGAAGAAGLTYVEAEKSGSVKAGTSAGARVKAPAVLISAASSGAVKADALVGVAGLGIAAGANHALARDSVAVAATLGASAEIDAATASLMATGTPQVQARSAGAGVSGSVQVGLSEAQAQVAGSTTATVGAGTTFGNYGTSAGLVAGNLTVKAQQLVATGKSSADAQAYAIGGGVLAGLNGAMALASNIAQVTANVGDNVTLPMGNVLIDATGNSVQNAVASGVSVGGLLAAGADIASATSNIDTAATLGQNADRDALASAKLPSGALSILARGVDSNQATAQAGAGGIVAGAAALATTATTGSTIAAIAPDAASNAASSAQVFASLLTVDASHTANFLATSNAAQGSLAGGSGANSSNTVDFNVAATVGAGVRVDANDIAVTALNTGVELTAQPNATGISGGLVAGAGVTSTNTLHTATRASVGNNAVLTVSGDPLDTPGNLRISAGNIVAAADSATVDSGGAFAALSASSRTDVTADNAVTIGAGAILGSVGDLELGTFSQAYITNDSYVHGYGLVAGASGSAQSNITVNQNVDVGANALVNSWGNMTIATGRAPGAASFNSLVARANNQVYADGAIGGADPEARANIASYGTVTVHDGAQLNSVRDIALSSLAGSVTASATGEGHYRVLGIPFSNQDASTTTPGTQTAVMNGSAVAGTRHNVALAIDANGNITSDKVASSNLASYDPVGQLTSQVAALTVLSNAAMNATDKADIDAQIKTLNGLITTLNGRGLSAGSPVKAVEVFDTLAAAGNITIDSGAFSGHGSLDAWGGPAITLTNDSSKFLVVDKLFIPNELGGNIRFNGAGQPAAQFAATEHAPNAAASISISNNYDTSIPYSSAIAPAIFLTNSIENIGGALSIYNKSGDLGQFGSVNVNSESVLVPNGAYIVNTPNFGFFLNGDPQGQYFSSTTNEVYNLTWDAQMGALTPGVALPGGANPLSTPSGMFQYGEYRGGIGAPGSPEEAVTYVANYVAQSQGYTGTTSAQLTAFLMGGLGTNPNTRVNDGTSTMFFYTGSAYADCRYCRGISSDEYRAMYGYDTGFYYGGNPRYNYPTIAQRTLTNSIAVLAPTTSGATKITKVGTTAIINAKFIDINGTIQVGLPTDLSANIAPQSIATGVDSHGVTIMRDLIDCINDVTCRPFAAGLQQSSGLYKYSAAANAGDTAVDVYYDANTRQLVLQNISGGGSGSVSLRGAIINTNAGGSNIEVSNGYAHVTVNNSTGANLQTSDINTGDGNVGLVKITDTLQTDAAGNPVTTWYVNRLGLGMSTYQSSTATDYAGLAPVSTSSTASTQYNPLTGERYYWQYDADLTREFNVGSSWAASTALPWTWTALPTNAANTYGGVWAVTSGLENRPDLVNAQFSESISGSTTSSGYHLSYTENGKWSWYFDIVTGVHIAARASVKADNPINIKFTGNNTAGLVAIASNSNVVVGGTIQNAGGATNISATGATSTITANANGVINTQSVNLAAGAGIGSLEAPLTVNLVQPFGSATSANQVRATTASGDIGLSLTGVQATISNVAAGTAGTPGDVLLQGYGNLVGDTAASGAVVTGRNLTIDSTNGAIGTNASPLAIQAISNLDQSGALVGGIVNASGREGVSLRQVDGDLYIGHVTSPGDVTLVASGSILDGRNIATTSRDAELAALWDKMQLQASSADNSAVIAFQNSIVAQYGSFKNLLALNAATDGSFRLTAAGVALLQAQANGAKGGAIAATADEVQAWALQRYTTLHTALVAAAVLDYSTAVADFTFTAAPSDVAQLTRGQYWSTNDLLYQINAAALAPAGSALVSVPDAGITGARLTLVSTARDIGSLAPAVHFVLNADGSWGNLTAAQKAALASATSAGDLVNQVYRNVAGGRQLVSFDILQTRPVDLDVGAALVAHADHGSIYLAAKGTLPIDSVSAAGDVRISSEAGMLNVNSEGATAVTAGHDLVLQNGHGAIGTAQRYLAIAAGNALTARSGDTQSGDLYLEALRGDLAFNNLFATGTVALKTSDTATGSGNIVGKDATGLGLASIAARALLLDTTGSVYQDNHAALQVQLADGATAGTVAGIVRGTLDVANAATLRLDGLNAIRHANITANSGDLQVGFVTGPDLALFATTGKITGVASTIGGGVNINSTGTVTLNGGSAKAATAAGTGIGTSASDRLIVNTRILDAATGTGAMWIGLAGSTGRNTSVLATANAGSTLDISASTDFTATRIISAKDQDSGLDTDTGGDIRLATTGTAVATLANIDAGRDLYLDSVNGQFESSTGASVKVARDLYLTMTGNGTMNDSATTSGGLSAGRDIVMNAAALNLGTLTAVRNIDLTARSGDLGYRNLTATNGDVLIDAAGTIRGTAGGTLSAHGDARLDATSISLNNTHVGNDAWLTVNGGTLAVDGASAIARDLHLTSTGTNTLANPLDAKLGAGRDIAIDAAALSGLVASAGRDLRVTARSGDIGYTRLAAQRDVRATASGAITAATGATIAATTNVDLAAATLAVGDITAGNNVHLASSGNLAGTGTVKAASFDIDASLDARLHSLAASGAGAIHAGGNLTVDAVATGGALHLDAGGATSVADVQVGGDLQAAGTALKLAAAHVRGNALLAATAGMQVDHASVGGDATFNAGTMQLGAIASGASLAATADTNLAYTTLAAGRDLTLAAGSAITGTPASLLQAGGNASASAASLLVHDVTAGGAASLAATGGDVDVTGTVQAAAVGIDAALDAHLHVLQATGDAMVRTGANLALDQATTGGALTLRAAGAADVAAVDAGTGLATTSTTLALSTARVGGDATLATNAGMRVDQATVRGNATFNGQAIVLGAIDSGATLAATAAADLAYTNLVAQQAINLQAGGTIAGASVQAATFAIDAGANADLQALQASGAGVVHTGGNLAIGVANTGGLTLRATGAATVASAEVKGDLDASSATLALHTARVDGSAVLASTAGMTLGTVTAGALHATAGTDLVYTTLVASRDVQLDAGGNIAGASVQTATFAIDAGLDADLQALQASVAGVVHTGGDLSIGQAGTGGDLTLRAAGAATVASAELKGDLDASGATLAVDTAHVDGSAVLASTAGMTLGKVTAGALHATAGTDLAYTTLVANRDVQLNAGGNIAGASVQAAAIGIDAGADAHLQALHATGEAAIHAGRNLVLGQATTGANLAARAGNDLDFTTVNAGGNIAMTAGRALTGAAGSLLDAGANVDASAGTVLVADVTAGGTATLASTAGGITATGTVQANTLQVDAATNAALHALQVSGNGAVHAGADLAIDQASVGGNATLSADTMTLGAIDTGALLAATAGTRLAFTTLKSGADLDLVAGTAIAGGPGSLLQAGGNVHTNARSQQLADVTAAGRADLASSTGDLVATGTVRAAGVTATAGGNVALHVMANSADAQSRAGGQLAVDRLTATGPAMLAAGTDVRVGTLAVGDNTHASDLNVRAGGLVQVGTGAVQGSLDTSSASLDLGTVRVANTALLATTGAMQLTALTVGGNVTASAGTALRVGSLQGGTDVRLRGADVALGTVQAANDLAVAARASAQLGNTTAGRDLAVAAGGAVNAASGTTQQAGRDIRIDAAQVRLGAMQAGRDGTVTSATSITADALAAERNLTLNAGTTLTAGTLRAGELLQMNAVQGIDIGAMWAANLGATTAGVLRIGDLALGSTATLAARNIDVGVRQAGTQGLTVSATGYQGGVADAVTLRVDAPAGLTLPSLRARTAQVTSTAHSNRIDRGYITGSLQLTTPGGVMVMNNTSAATLAGTGIQLYTPDLAFMLSQVGSQYYTDAYVTQYSGDARPTVPNYQENHLHSPVLVYGSSAARDAERDASTNVKQATVAGATEVAQLALLAPLSLVHAGATAVNLGDQDGIAREQDLVIDAKLKLN